MRDGSTQILFVTGERPIRRKITNQNPRYVTLSTRRGGSSLSLSLYKLNPHVCRKSNVIAWRNFRCYLGHALDGNMCRENRLTIEGCDLTTSNTSCTNGCATKRGRDPAPREKKYMHTNPWLNAKCRRMTALTLCQEYFMSFSPLSTCQTVPWCALYPSLSSVVLFLSSLRSSLGDVVIRKGDEETLTDKYGRSFRRSSSVDPTEVRFVTVPDSLATLVVHQGRLVRRERVMVSIRLNVNYSQLVVTATQVQRFSVSGEATRISSVRLLVVEAGPPPLSTSE